MYPQGKNNLDGWNGPTSVIKVLPIPLYPSEPIWKEEHEWKCEFNKIRKLHYDEDNHNPFDQLGEKMLDWQKEISIKTSAICELYGLKERMIPKFSTSIVIYKKPGEKGTVRYNGHKKYGMGDNLLITTPWIDATVHNYKIRQYGYAGFIVNYTPKEGKYNWQGPGYNLTGYFDTPEDMEKWLKGDAIKHFELCLLKALIRNKR